jgi:heptosyltransferase-2
MDLKHKKIAVIGLRRIGDAVYTLPSFEAIKRFHPSAHITVFTELQVAAIYQHNSFIDEIESYTKKIFWKESLKALKSGNFDLCIINHNALKYAVLAFLAGIPIRVGYQKEGRSVFLSHKRHLPPLGTHRLEHNALLLDLLNIESRDLLPRIYEGGAESVQSQVLLERFSLVENGYVVLIVGSIAETRRWFPDNFAALAQKIISELELQVVILGGPDDRDIADQIYKLCSGNQSELMNLAGETSLRETILLFNRAKAIASNDTGPLHVASAMAKPVVTWFGAGDENATAPTSDKTLVLNANLDCSPCLKEVCPLKTLECLHQVTVEQVFTALKRIV